MTELTKELSSESRREAQRDGVSTPAPDVRGRRPKLLCHDPSDHCSGDRLVFVQGKADTVWVARGSRRPCHVPLGEKPPNQREQVDVTLNTSLVRRTRIRRRKPRVLHRHHPRVNALCFRRRSRDEVIAWRDSVGGCPLERPRNIPASA